MARISVKDWFVVILKPIAIIVQIKAQFFRRLLQVPDPAVLLCLPLLERRLIVLYQEVSAEGIVASDQSYEAHAMHPARLGRRVVLGIDCRRE